MKVLLIYPPIGNLIAPYLSVPALSAFLKAKGIEVTCVDLNILAFDRLLSPDFLTEAGQFCEKRYRELDSKDRLSYVEAEEYVKIAQFVPRWHYLSENITLAKACIRGEKQEAAFGNFGSPVSLIKAALELVFIPFSDSEFFIFESLNSLFYSPSQKYAPFSSDGIVEWVFHQKSRFDKIYEEILIRHFQEDYDVIGISVSYENQMAQALRIAKLFKDSGKNALRVLGGVYLSLACAELQKSRLFDIIDILILNDGEGPLLDLIRFRKGELSIEDVPNAVWKDSFGKVRHNRMQSPVPFAELFPPDFSHTPFKEYLCSASEMELPMLLSRGCYWRKCAFCEQPVQLLKKNFQIKDVHKQVIPDIQYIINRYGIHRFHFVDETIPPPVIFCLSQAIIKTGLRIQWRGNIRAEVFFTPLICQLMSQAGCFHVEIGIETFNDDLLKSMGKGTSQEGIVNVVSNFHDTGIVVHTYMICGLPGETREHMANNLRMLKKLIFSNRIDSLAWHLFYVCRWSKIYQNPSAFGIRNLELNPEFDLQVTFKNFDANGDFNRNDRKIYREKVERFTNGLFARAQSTLQKKSKAQKVSQELYAGKFELLDGFLIFPPYFALCGGNYSISQIKGEKGAEEYHREVVIERKPCFRAINCLSGAWYEFSEDICTIINECRSASFKEKSLRYAVNKMAQIWQMDHKAIGSTVLSILPQLRELGICIAEPNIPVSQSENC